MEEEKYISLTGAETGYIVDTVGLSAQAAAGSGLGEKLGSLCMRIRNEFNNEEPGVFLDADDKNLVSAGLMVYELLVREKYDVLKEHFQVGDIHVTPEQIRAKAAEVQGNICRTDLDLKAFQKKLRNRRTVPVRKLYIADLHFFHDSLNRHMDMRGFSGYEEMNAYMLRQWNDNVTEKDEVYILGDFAISRAEPAEEVLRKLNGKKYLLQGNHDRFLDNKKFDRSLFKWVRPYAEIQDSGRKVILSHYPVFCYNGQYRLTPEGKPLAYMLYGHVHNTHDERLVNSFIRRTRETMVFSEKHPQKYAIPCGMINCFCMFSNYVPLTLDEWIRLDDRRRKELNQADEGGL